MGREDTKETSGIADNDSVKQMRMSGNGGFLSRLWKAVFRPHDDDFEKRLQHISKEEAAVLARINRRSRTRRNIIRHLIVFSVLLEVFIQFICTRATNLSNIFLGTNICWNPSIHLGYRSRLCYYDNKINGFELEDEIFSSLTDVSSACFIIPCLFCLCKVHQDV